jgi:hypothetical protein
LETIPGTWLHENADEIINFARQVNKNVEPEKRVKRNCLYKLLKSGRHA